MPEIQNILRFVSKLDLPRGNLSRSVSSYKPTKRQSTRIAKAVYCQGVYELHGYAYFVREKTQYRLFNRFNLRAVLSNHRVLENRVRTCPS
jgi:hypothetical protein